MAFYVVRRLLLLIPTFIGITLLVFALTRMVPGGPIERQLMQMNDTESQVGNVAGNLGPDGFSSAERQQLANYFSLDQPTMPAYWNWFMRVLQFDFGYSTRYDDPVLSLIGERLSVSLFYGLSSMFIVYVLCIPLGILKALHHQSLWDSVSSILLLFAFAVPSYVLGMALLSVFAAKLNWFPLGQFVSDNFADRSVVGKIIDVMQHAALPLTSYVAGSLAFTTLLMKNTLLDSFRMPFVQTAMAKGLSYRQAILKHAVPNSLIPIATTFGTNLGMILGGSFLIETLFSIDGMGLLGYEALLDRDYPVVLGILVITSLLFLIGNLLADVLVATLDPRIKFQGADRV